MDEPESSYRHGWSEGYEFGRRELRADIRAVLDETRVIGATAHEEVGKLRDKLDRIRARLDQEPAGPTIDDLIKAGHGIEVTNRPPSSEEPPGETNPEAEEPHVIEIREDGWTIQHPLACRPNLFDCPVNRAAGRELREPPGEFGRFECGLADDGNFIIGSEVQR